MLKIYNDIDSKIKVSSIAIEIIKVIVLMLGLAIVSQFKLYIYVVPLTLQTSYITIVSLLVKKRISIEYLTLYILLVVSGAPFLSGMQSLNSTNITSLGFVIGFLFMALIVNYFLKENKTKSNLTIIKAIIVANITLYIIGFGWITLLGNKISLLIILPFIVFDTLKMSAVVILYKIINNYITE